MSAGKLTPPVTLRLDDMDAEKMRRNFEQRIAELQALASLRSETVRNVVIASNDVTMVAHGLGRDPVQVTVSPVRIALASLGSLTPGVIVDFGFADRNGNPLDRTRVFQLGAFGFSIPITVDVTVA